MVKQDIDEAKVNIDRRLEHIQRQLKDVDAALKQNDAKQREIEKKIMVSHSELIVWGGRQCLSWNLAVVSFCASLIQ